jgi:di/tricarboxylate transporter
VNPQFLFVIGLLVACIGMFVANKPRMDVVALLVIVILPLSGILKVSEAIAGFSDPNVILIAAMFVIGEGLVRTGIAFRLGDWLVAKAAGNETRLLVLLMLATAGLGSVMSSTGVVAIFIPVVLGIADRMGVRPGRLMMPLSFSALISGMLTLVATPPPRSKHRGYRKGNKIPPRVSKRRRPYRAEGSRHITRRSPHVRQNERGPVRAPFKIRS